jgi:ATP-dependent Clp protease ATP-binding subunit ClpC
MMRVRYREGPTALSERSQKAFQLAHQEAQRLGDPAVGSEHLLLGLAKEADSPAAVLLRQLGYDLEWLRGRVSQARSSGPGSPLPGALGYTPDLEAFLDALVAAAESSGVMPLTPEYVLAALTREADGAAAGILRQRWFALWRLRRKLRRVVTHR